MDLERPSASGRRLGDRRASTTPRWPLAFFLGLSLLVFLPLLGRGYVLTLDMVFGPHTSHLADLFRASDPLYYGRLPVAALLDAVGVVIPQWAIQRGVLLGIVAGSGLSMFRAVRTRTTTGALFAGTLYAVNPFVYVRLLAGHWWLLLGYAVLPLAVVSFADAIEGRGRPRRAAAYAAVVSAFDPHASVLLAVAWACLGAAAVARGDRRRVVGRVGRAAALAVAFDAYWLVPAVATVLAGRSKVAAMSGLDLVAFGTRGTVAGNVPLSVATLLGFWRDGYRLPVPTLPLPAWLCLFGLLLLAAVAGWYDNRDDALASGLLLLGVVGFVLGLGVSVDATAPLFRALYDHVVVFRGMRDAQKFVALLALAYAFLGGLGVDRLVDWFALAGSERPVAPTGDGRPASARPERTGTTPSLSSRRTAAVGVLTLLVLLAPLAYSWPMLWGFSGQLHDTHYPDGWGAANDRLLSDPGPYRVLALPWHQYLTFPWTDGRVANPVGEYVQRPVVRSRSIDLAGIESQASSPAGARVSAILEDPSAASPLGSSLAPLGVKYVLVEKAADYRRYDYLRHQPDLVVVEENDDVVLFENRAFGTAPPPEQWPRDVPVVPWPGLLLGATASVVALLVAFAGRPDHSSLLGVVGSLR